MSSESFDSELATELVHADVEELTVKEQSYGGSWKKRGGVDSFMMLARKWDRIEHQVGSKYGWNILTACEAELHSADGILDDIRDLRRYLILVEAEVVSRLTNDKRGEKNND